MKNMDRTQKLCLAAVLCACPAAVLALGQSAGEIAFYACIIPFFISTAAGAALSGVVLEALSRSGALKRQGKEG